MKTRTLIFSTLVLFLFSCETKTEETTIPLDTAAVKNNQDSKNEVIVNYFKNIPPLPSAYANIKPLLVDGKWVVADYKVENIDKSFIPGKETPESIHDNSLFPVRDFSFTANADQTIVIQKPQLSDCPKRIFEVNTRDDKPVLTIICEEDLFELNFEILGINQDLLYLKENKGEYPFDTYYIMKKE